MGNINAYQYMETEFEGFPKTEEIKPFMEKALEMYNFENTEQNINIFGAILVMLKRQQNVPEMDILKHICEFGEPSVSYKMQATISAVYLSKFKK